MDQFGFDAAVTGRTFGKLLVRVGDDPTRRIAEGV